MYTSKPPSQGPLYQVGQMPRYPLERQRIPVPVGVASWLMYVVAALQALNIILTLSSSSGTTVIMTLIFSILWVRMASRIRAGRNSGRIGATIFFCLYTFILILVFVSNGPPAGLVLSVLLFWLLAAAIVTLLWLSGNAEHFGGARVADQG
jgi:hypothetical protein